MTTGNDSILSVGLDLVDATVQSAGEVASGVASAVGEIASAAADQPWKHDLGEGLADRPKPPEPVPAPAMEESVAPSM